LGSLNIELFLSSQKNGTKTNTYLDNTVNKAAVYLGVVGLVHQLGAEDVERRHGACHEKASRKRCAEVSGDALGDKV